MNQKFSVSVSVAKEILVQVHKTIAEIAALQALLESAEHEDLKS